MIKVIRVSHAFEGPRVYIGRPRKEQRVSPLGNPFVIGRDGDRSQVIALYRQWLWTKVQARDDAVLGALRKIAVLEDRAGVVALDCFCSPEPCHGDVIVKAIAWLRENHK